MELNDYTDLTYRERTLLAEYRLSDTHTQEKILEALRALNEEEISVKSAKEHEGNL